MTLRGPLIPKPPYGNLGGEREGKMKTQTKAKCVECGRVFDLLDEEQAGEFYYGHDCEV